MQAHHILEQMPAGIEDRQTDRCFQVHSASYSFIMCYPSMIFDWHVCADHLNPHKQWRGSCTIAIRALCVHRCMHRAILTSPHGLSPLIEGHVMLRLFQCAHNNRKLCFLVGSLGSCIRPFCNVMRTIWNALHCTQITLHMSGWTNNWSQLISFQ